MKSLPFLVAAVSGWPSGFARGTAEYHGWQLRAALPLTLLLLFAPTPTTASAGIRGGFGERQPGLEDDTEGPLFDLNVLVTGAQRILCPRSLLFMCGYGSSLVYAAGSGLSCGERTVLSMEVTTREIHTLSRGRKERVIAHARATSGIGHLNSRLYALKHQNVLFTMLERYVMTPTQSQLRATLRIRRLSSDKKHEETCTLINTHERRSRSRGVERALRGLAERDAFLQ